MSLTTLGCVATGGPVAVHSVANAPPATAIGARLTGSLLLARDQGILAGGDLETTYLTNPSEHHGPHPKKGSLHLGYGQAPLPHRTAVGFEALTVAGFGNHSIDDQTKRAWSVGPRIGLPIRLGDRRALWDTDEKVDVTWAVVPTLEWRFLIPVESDPSPSVRNEVAVGLALRMHTWTGLMP